MPFAFYQQVENFKAGVVFYLLKRIFRSASIFWLSYLFCGIQPHLLVNNKRAMFKFTEFLICDGKPGTFFRLWFCISEFEEIGSSRFMKKTLIDSLPHFNSIVMINLSYVATDKFL